MATVVILVLGLIIAAVLLATFMNQASVQASAPVAEPAPGAAPATGAGLAGLVLTLPEPARTRAWNVLCLLEDAGRDPAAPPLDERASYLVQQTRDSYLPDTLRAYAALTEGARQALARRGQSAEGLLEEQLALIERGVQGALRRDHHAADRLLTQGSFLRERFGEAGQDLKLPARGPGQRRG